MLAGSAVTVGTAGAAFTVTVAVSVSVQPLASVTVTVYVPLLLNELVALLALDPPVH
jgi:hypothetical protein